MKFLITMLFILMTMGCGSTTDSVSTISKATQTIESVGYVADDLVLDTFTEDELESLIDAIDVYKTFYNAWHNRPSSSNLGIDEIELYYIQVRTSYTEVRFIVRKYWQQYPPDLRAKLWLIDNNVKELNAVVRQAKKVRDKAEMMENILSIGLAVVKVASKVPV